MGVPAGEIIREKIRQYGKTEKGKSLPQKSQTDLSLFWIFSTYSLGKDGIRVPRISSVNLEFFQGCVSFCEPLRRLLVSMRSEGALCLWEDMR